MGIRSALLTIGTLFTAFQAGCVANPVTLSVDGLLVHVQHNGQPFATVHTAAQPRPFIWPLLAHGGVPVTRNHPMGERENEQLDHPHHQSVWLAHGKVNGFDFWHGKGHRERIVLEDVQVSSSEHPYASVSCEYHWVVDEDTLIMREVREMRFHVDGGVRFVDVLVTFFADEADVVFGDTKEGTFAMRVHPALRVDGTVATGSLTNSEGLSGKGVWGKRARWIDDSGYVDGVAVGVTMFDHPSNLRFPTWWHARNYGLLAANPFGVHDFERKPGGSGDLLLPKGDPLTLRYRIAVHGSDWDVERIEAAYAAWSATR